MIGPCYPQRRAEEFRALLDVVQAQILAELGVHVIVDNYITHETKTTQKWLRAHPNVHFHFTLTSACWLNLVESWFSLLSQKRLKRGNFKSKAALEQAMTTFIAQTYVAPKPFVRTRSADDILANIKRFCERYLPADNCQRSSESNYYR